MLTALLFGGFLLASFPQIFVWSIIFSKIRTWYPKESTGQSSSKTPSEGVSLIVCAHNEAENLSSHLPFLLSQDFDNYEVIVVDDKSFDKSAQIVLEFQKTHSILRLVSADEPSSPNKKAALSLGIQNARFDILLLTDADCYPASKDWLRLMTQPLREGAELVLGYGPYQSRNGWLNRFLRFETVYTAIQFFSFAILGLPYMGVGRNIAYRKNWFFRAGGFQAHRRLLSGDDDLLVNQAARAATTAVVLQPSAFVYSRPKETWRGYYRQKRRHLSTGGHYRLLHRLVLAGVALSHFLHYELGLLTLVVAPRLWPHLLGIYLVRMMVVLWVWAGAVKRLREPHLLAWVPLLDPLLLVYYLVFAPALLTGSHLRQWK